MTTLRLYPDGSGENFDWALLGNDGQIMHAGIHTGINDVPPAAQCELILPAAKVLLTRAKIPKANKRRQAALLPFAVEEQLISEPDLNHVAMGASFPDGSVALAVIDKAWFAQLLERLKTHNLSPKRAAPETLLPMLEALCWTIVWADRCGFLRTGEFSGLALDGNDDAPPLALKLALQAAAGPDFPKKIILHVTAGHAPDIQQWRAALAVDIELGANWDWRTGAGTAPINLLQGEFGPRQIDLSWLPRLRPALVMLLLMLAVQFFGMVADWALLAREKADLSAAMTRIFRASFPDANVVVDAPLQMARKLAELRHAAGFQAAGDFLPLLAAVSRQLAALPEGELKAIDYEPDQLGLSIALPGSDSATSLQTKLATPHLKVVLEKVAPDANGSGVTAYFTVSPGGA